MDKTIFNKITIIKENDSNKMIGFKVFNNDNKVIKSYQIYNNDSNLEVDNIYDKKGNVIKETINSVVREYKYNENNKLIEMNWNNRKVYKHEYDKYNNIKKIIMPHSATDVENKYNENGKLIECVNPLYRTIIKHKYNEKGLLIKQLIEHTDVKVKGEIIYEYDKKDRLIKETATKYDDLLEITYDDYNIYKYNSNNRLIYKDEMIKIYGKEKHNIDEFIYNIKDVLIEEKHYTKNNMDLLGNKRDEIFLHYKYNKDGLLIYQNENNVITKYEYPEGYYYYFINPDKTDLIVEELCDGNGRVYFTKFKDGKIKTYFK